MKQTERIQTMEQHLNEAIEAINELTTALEKYRNAQESIEKLKAYLSSKEWKKDFRDSEDGRLPADLKCGVLSEDGIWNMLEDANDLKTEMLQIIAETTNDK